MDPLNDVGDHSHELFNMCSTFIVCSIVVFVMKMLWKRVVLDVHLFLFCFCDSFHFRCVFDCYLLVWKQKSKYFYNCDSLKEIIFCFCFSVLTTTGNICEGASFKNQKRLPCKIDTHSLVSSVYDFLACTPIGF